MQKIKDFETFAAGYFLGLGIKKPTAEDICRLSVECRAFAAALSFYMFTDPYVLSKVRTPDKYEAVAKNIQCFSVKGYEGNGMTQICADLAAH